MYFTLVSADSPFKSESTNGSWNLSGAGPLYGRGGILSADVISCNVDSFCSATVGVVCTSSASN